LALKITISFKDTEEEVYNWVKEHSNYSGFLKDMIKKEMKKEMNAQSK
jgi:hypothetical protein